MAAAALALVPVVGVAEAAGDSKPRSPSGADPLAETSNQLATGIVLDGPRPQPAAGTTTKLAVADAPRLDPIEDLAAPARRPASSRSNPIGETIVVRPGDSLWSIASRKVGPSASIEDIAGYVRQIWARNADRVPSGKADQLDVGQRLVLPSR